MPEKKKDQSIVNVGLGVGAALMAGLVSMWGVNAMKDGESWGVTNALISVAGVLIGITAAIAAFAGVSNSDAAGKIGAYLGLSGDDDTKKRSRDVIMTGEKAVKERGDRRYYEYSARVEEGEEIDSGESVEKIPCMAFNANFRELLLDREVPIGALVDANEALREAGVNRADINDTKGLLIRLGGIGAERLVDRIERAIG